MATTCEKSRSAVWTGALIFSAVALLAGFVLAVSYNGAQKLPHSDSWNGPSETVMNACSGPVTNWMQGLEQHRSRPTDSISAPEATGFFTRFATRVVPWHLENRPAVIYLFAFLELAVVFGTYRLWVLEKAEVARGGR